MTNEEIKSLTYTQAVEKLEALVAKMQSPECDIDSLAEYTKDAIALMNHCKEKLHATDEAVKQCLAALAETV